MEDRPKVKRITFLSIEEIKRLKEEEKQKTEEQRAEHNKRVKRVFKIPVKEDKE